MKKNIIAYWIIFILLIVVFNGCIESNKENNVNDQDVDLLIEDDFNIENKAGKKYVYLLNENESKPIKKIKPSKLKPITKNLKYIIEKRTRKNHNSNAREGKI